MAHHIAPRARGLQTHPQLASLSCRRARALRYGRARRAWLIALALIGLACVAGFWLAGQRAPWSDRYEATAWLKVSAPAPLIGERDAGDVASFDAFRRSQPVLMTSPLVLAAAMRNEQVAKLPLLAAQEDPAGFLARHLRVDFPGDGTLMRVSLSGPRSDELQTIVDAVVDAYLVESVQRETHLQHLRLAQLKKILAANQAKLAHLQARLGEGEPDATKRGLEQIDRALAALHDELMSSQRDASALELQTALSQARLEQAKAQAPSISGEELKQALESDPEYQRLAARRDELRNLLDEMKARAAGADNAAIEQLVMKIAAAGAELTTRQQSVLAELTASRQQAEVARLTESLIDYKAERAARIDVARRLEDRLKVENAQAQALNVKMSKLQLAMREIEQLEGITAKIATARESLQVELMAPPGVELLNRASTSERPWAERVAVNLRP